MMFSRACPFCPYETNETPMLPDSDREFQEHMQAEHIDDGNYKKYLVDTLGVNPSEADANIADVVFKRENPQQ